MGKRIKEETFRKYCLVVDEYVVNGMHQGKAVQKFYPKYGLNAASTEFNRMLKIPRIKEYYDTKLQNKANELNITLDVQLKRLDDIIYNAERESDKINAIKEQNKLLALYKEHNKQKQQAPTFKVYDAR